MYGRNHIGFVMRCAPPSIKWPVSPRIRPAHPLVQTDPAEYNEIVTKTMTGRHTLDRGWYSDPLMMLNLYDIYSNLASGAGSKWCGTVANQPQVLHTSTGKCTDKTCLCVLWCCVYVCLWCVCVCAAVCIVCVLVCAVCVCVCCVYCVCLSLDNRCTKHGLVVGQMRRFTSTVQSLRKATAKGLHRRVHGLQLQSLCIIPTAAVG